MSLQAIEEAIEKVALLSHVGGALMKAPALKAIGARTALGAVGGGVGNAIAGSSDEGVVSRFAKGALGGAVVAGGHKAGQVGLKAYAKKR